MRLGDARIGYAGYSRDWAAPGDRRRFCAFAAQRMIRFERAQLDRPYDVAYVTSTSDLPGWVRRKRREGDGLKLVFELIDSYFQQAGLGRRLLKGTARYALGVDSNPSPDFLRTLRSACEAADAVVCSTEEQRNLIRRFNPNVFISFDYFGDDIGQPKQDYGRTGKLRLVWEGQSTTLRHVQSIRNVLNGLRDPVELHIVTDPIIHRYFGRFGAQDAMDALRGIECDIVFHPWRLNGFSNAITAADVAIIPIDVSDSFARGKPENKLVMLWQLGMPVMTSATPAYKRAMDAAGLDLLCSDSAQWRHKLEGMASAPPTKLAALGKTGREFAERAYSKEEFQRRFGTLFEALGFEV